MPVLKPVLRRVLRPVLRSPFEAGGGAALAPPTANLAAWYKKGVGITHAANAVSQWDDQSGNARHLLQATGAVQPTLQGDGTIKFTSDYMTAVFSIAAPMSIYARMKQDAWAGSDIVFALTSYSHLVWQRGATPQLVIYAGTDVANTSMTLSTWSNLGVVLKSGFNAVGSVLRVDSTSNTGSPGTVGSSMTGLTIGANTDGFGAMDDATFSDILFYAADHDSTQQDAVFAYLSTR